MDRWLRAGARVVGGMFLILLVVFLVGGLTELTVGDPWAQGVRRGLLVFGALLLARWVAAGWRSESRPPA